MSKDKTPAAQKFSVWLSEAAKATREREGVSVDFVAAYAGVRAVTIERFERSGSGTMDGQSRTIAAYAEACGLADGREIYRRAIDLWFENVDRPLTLESVSETAGAAAAGDGEFEGSVERARQALRSGARRPAPVAPKPAAKRNPPA